MQKGIGNEAERGFYNITMDSVADSASNYSYTVAFEDRNDAQNFSYLLESAFEDLPDAAVDIAPLSKRVCLQNSLLLQVGETTVTDQSCGWQA